MATEENITNIIEISFHLEEKRLKGTTAETIYNTYISDKNLKKFKEDLETYRDSLTGDNEMRTAHSVNSLLQIAEVLFIANHTGDSSLTSLTLLGSETSAADNLSDQLANVISRIEASIGINALDKAGFLGATESSPSSFSTYANLVTATLGKGKLLEYEAEKGSISEAIGTIETGLLNKKGTSLASAIGNVEFKDFNLVGTQTKASDSLSAQVVSLALATEAAIGTDALEKSGFLGATEANPESLVAHANLVTTALGNGKILENEAEKGSISEAIGTIETGLLNKEGTSLASAIGNSPLKDFTLLGIKTRSSDSLSEQLSSFILATENALGKSAIAPSTARTVNLCSYSRKKGGLYTLEDEIYTTSKDQSQTMLNYFNCGKKIDEVIDKGESIYISHTGLVGDCSSRLDAGEAMAKCIHYLHPDV